MKLDHALDALVACAVVLGWFVAMTPLVAFGLVAGTTGKLLVLAVLVALVWLALRLVRSDANALAFLERLRKEKAPTL